MDTKQPEALALAEELRTGKWMPNILQNEEALRDRAADELQILHAENESLRRSCDTLRERVQMLGQLARDVNSRRVLELEAQLEAVGAGGVSALMAAPNGWQLVPVEPTSEMVIEAYKAQGEATSSACEEIYRAMLAAAPSGPARKPLTDEQIAAAQQGTDAS